MTRLPILICCGLLVACSTSPTGRSQFSFLPQSQLQQLGDQAFDKIKQETPQSKDSRTNAYVQCVSRAIVQEVGGGGSWDVVVFDKNTANAFALPGGHIGVHTGLLKVAKSQDQLAAVLGHEVAHVIAGHSGERVSQQLAVQTGLQLGGSLAGQSGSLLMSALGLGAEYGILKPFGRTQESEADTVGLGYMAKAGFDPRESVELWRNMSAASSGAPPEFLSTHPSHGTRIENLSSRMPEALSQYEAARSRGKRPSCG